MLATPRVATCPSDSLELERVAYSPAAAFSSDAARREGLLTGDEAIVTDNGFAGASSS
jgi:hypothetical protein